MKLLAAVLLATAALPAAPLDDGFRQMYNLQFEAAHRTFAAWSQQNPADPMGPVADAAAYLFSELDRLHILESEFLTDDQSFLDFHKPAADPAVTRKLEAALAKTQKLAEAALVKTPDDTNAQLASALRWGLHADYLALIEKRNMAALSEVKQGRMIAERLLAKHPDVYDAYLAIGIENYLLSLKPAPIRWILHAGGSETDRTTGLAKLLITAEKGHYLLPYARVLLAIADLRDHDPTRARQWLSWLAKEYPGNRLYREELAKLPNR